MGLRVDWDRVEGVAEAGIATLLASTILLCMNDILTLARSQAARKLE